MSTLVSVVGRITVPLLPLGTVPVPFPMTHNSQLPWQSDMKGAQAVRLLLAPFPLGVLSWVIWAARPKDVIPSRTWKKGQQKTGSRDVQRVLGSLLASWVKKGPQGEEWGPREAENTRKGALSRASRKSPTCRYPGLSPESLRCFKPLSLC